MISEVLSQTATSWLSFIFVTDCLMPLKNCEVLFTLKSSKKKCRNNWKLCI